MITTETPLDSALEQVRADIRTLIEELWPNGADGLRRIPAPLHPLPAMVRLLAWWARHEPHPTTLIEPPRITVDHAALAAVISLNPTSAPDETRGPTALLDTTAMLIDAVSKAEARAPWTQLFRFASSDSASPLPARIRHEFTGPTQEPRSGVLSVHLAAPSGLVLATVAYRSNSDLLHPPSDSAPRSIATIEDLVTALVTDLNAALAQVWDVLRELPR